MDNTTPSTEPLDDIQPKSDAEMVQLFDKIYRDDTVVADAVDAIAELVPTTPETEAQRLALVYGTPAPVDIHVDDMSLATDEDQESEVLLTDGAEFPMLSTADAAGADVNSKLLGIDVDPDADVTEEMAALSAEDRKRIEALREMGAAENMNLTDAQLLGFLKNFKKLHEATDALAPKKRDVNEKAKAKRRAAAKAAKESRKRNRR